MDRLLAHLDRGWDMISQGDTTRAYIAAHNALKLDSESPEVHNMMGYVHALDGDLDEALNCYRKAMELDEYYLDPVLNTVEILVRTNTGGEEAIELCEKVMDISVDEEEVIEATILEANALLNLGKVGRARQMLAAIENTDQLPPPYILLVGRLMMDTGDLTQASQLMDLVCGLDPTNPDAWYYRGLIARQQDRTADCISDFLEARRLDLNLTDLVWTAGLEPLEQIVHRAIESLDPASAAMFLKSELRFAALPSEAMVREQVDPRQVVVLESSSSTPHEIDALWVFSSNLLRQGGQPFALEEELTLILEQELASLDEALQDN